MKLIVRLLSVGVAALCPLTLVWAQSSPSEKPAAAASSAPARNDVYHVYFGKAAPGKAVQLAEMLKTPNPKDPMPGHFILLRHQEGDAWDYCLITHIGTKATVEAAPFQVPSAMRDVSDWHNDTFVNGPSWEEFTKAMAISDDAKSKSGGGGFVVLVFLPPPRRVGEETAPIPPPPQNPIPPLLFKKKKKTHHSLCMIRASRTTCSA